MLQTKGDPKNVLTRDMFLTHQDVMNLLSKKAIETYHLHRNDALSVRMWVETSKEFVFHYTKTRKLGFGALCAYNVHFILGIKKSLAKRNDVEVWSQQWCRH